MLVLVFWHNIRAESDVYIWSVFETAFHEHLCTSWYQFGICSSHKTNQVLQLPCMMDNEMRTHTILVMLEIAKNEEVCNDATSYTHKPGLTRKGNCNTAPEQRDSAAAWSLRWMYGSNRTGCGTGKRCRGLCVSAQRYTYLRLRSSNGLRLVLSYESNEIIVDNTHANVQEP